MSLRDDFRALRQRRVLVGYDVRLTLLIACLSGIVVGVIVVRLLGIW